MAANNDDFANQQKNADFSARVFLSACFRVRGSFSGRLIRLPIYLALSTYSIGTASLRLVLVPSPS